MYYGALNWGTVPEWVGAILTAVSILTAAYIGLRAWEAQLKGSREYELAVRLTKNIYRVRNAIKDIRNPWMDAAEADRETEDDWTISAYQKRWETLNNANKDLQADLLEAEVFWDTEFNNPRDELRTQMNKLFIATKHYVTSRSKHYKNIQNIFSEKDELILYEVEGDDYNKELNKIIEKFEKKAKHHIKR